MSLCEKCYDPGRCCKHFDLKNVEGDILFPVEIPIEKVFAVQGDKRLPFEPLEVKDTFAWEGVTYQSWWWGCPKVDSNGRCTIYETRPTLCRSFEPASDALCVHYKGAEAGDPTTDMERI